MNIFRLLFHFPLVSGNAITFSFFYNFVSNFRIASREFRIQKRSQDSKFCFGTAKRTFRFVYFPGISRNRALFKYILVQFSASSTKIVTLPLRTLMCHKFAPIPFTKSQLFEYFEIFFILM